MTRFESWVLHAHRKRIS